MPPEQNTPSEAPQNEARRSEQFLRLYMQHESAVRSYVRSGLRTWNDTDDVMQEVAIVAMRKFDPEKDSEMFRRWLFVVARYEILKFRRGKSRDRLVLSEEVVESILDEGLEENAQSALDEKRDALNQCLLKLPEERRQFVMAAYASGGTIKDLAAQVGKSPQAMRQMLRRIRLELANCLELSAQNAGGMS